MIHSDEKVRQMARSLLPSTNRKGARRARAGIHRAARRQVQQELDAWLSHGDLERDTPPLAPWEGVTIHRQVSRRRSADKVNPFIRWATARTRDLPWEARWGHVRGILPQSVIGEHALSHLENTAAFEDPFEAEQRQRLRKCLARRHKGRVRDRGEQAGLLRRLLEQPDGQRTFNRFLRERHAWAASPRNVASRPRDGILPPHRPLLGAHDVLPFLDTLKRHPWGNDVRVWGTLDPPAHWVRLFLQRFKSHRGHIPSVRAALEEEGLLGRDPLAVLGGRAAAARARKPLGR
ncbi:hypothetical protein JYK02_18185 [Corallococcus macrosporus]|uniref:Uncharacterized protein n=1 Tax=Corallococcus macrosporus TaxID=35 RepID=A0ABS3DCW7_9BACT|nr:hypothetical protein [Corallococcus macrosporus]MBN8229443.1 hypothetical protein [Corallococcus macrosporus]